MEQPILAQAEQVLLQQAPVRPMDASGFTASMVGTGLFALAGVTALFFPHGFWLWVFVTGTALGGVLIAYTAWHKRYVRARAGTAQQAAPGADPAGDGSVED